MDTIAYENRLLLRPQIFQPPLPGISVAHSGIKDVNMSTIQTWTLWQRMPPRYQLTSRFYDDDVEELPVSFTPEKLPSTRSSASNSRPTSGLNRQHAKTQTQFIHRPLSGSFSPRKATKKASSQDEHGNFMLSTSGQLPENVNVEQITDVPTGSQNKFSFPRRQSDYVNNFQKQKRVNSARRRLAECPPSPVMGAPGSPRAHTAPVYPVTSPDSYSTSTLTFHDVRDNVKDVVRKAREESTHVMTPKKSKSTAETTKIGMFQFDDAKSPASSTSSGVAKPAEKQPKPKKYLIQDTNRSTMYIDNGKVICFGKSRHDLTQLLKTQSLRRDRNKSFFSDLRRDYLTHPKYGTGRDKQENDPRRVAHERIDYNRKVENILNYYSSDGKQEDARSPLAIHSSVLQEQGSISNRRSSERPVLNGKRSVKTPSRAESPVPEKGDAFGGFMKMNRQSKLYDRKFYLRTPALTHDGYTEAQLESCRCSVCRIELQLSIMTGVNHPALTHGNNAIGTCLPNHTDNFDTHRERARVGGVENNNGNESQTNGKHPNKDNKTGDKHVPLKVSFKQPDAEETTQEQRTLTISCTLPEMTHMAPSEQASESGFESSRTVVSAAQTDITV